MNKNINWAATDALVESVNVWNDSIRRYETAIQKLSVADIYNDDGDDWPFHMIEKAHGSFVPWGQHILEWLVVLHYAEFTACIDIFEISISIIYNNAFGGKE
jgi:hypothetical protein